MRSKLVNAVMMIGALMQLPPEPGKPFGDKAKDLDINTAARYASRAKRRMRSSGGGLNPAQLQQLGRKNRRRGKNR